MKELEERFAGKSGAEGSLKLDAYLLYFAFDVMGDLTYSRRTGFIESGKDAYGIIGFVKTFLGYGLIVGTIFLNYELVLHNSLTWHVVWSNAYHELLSST